MWSLKWKIFNSIQGNSSFFEIKSYDENKISLDLPYRLYLRCHTIYSIQPNCIYFLFNSLDNFYKKFWQFFLFWNNWICVFWNLAQLNSKDTLFKVTAFGFKTSIMFTWQSWNTKNLLVWSNSSFVCFPRFVRNQKY